MLLTIAMTAAFAAASPLAQDVPASPQEGVVITGEQNKKNKRVCKRSTPTGSVMQKVTCRTVSEWEADNERNQIALERMRGDQRWAEAARLEKNLAP